MNSEQWMFQTVFQNLLPTLPTMHCDITGGDYVTTFRGKRAFNSTALVWQLQSLITLQIQFNNTKYN